jgi:hypothetical protein
MVSVLYLESVGRHIQLSIKVPSNYFSSEMTLDLVSSLLTHLMQLVGQVPSLLAITVN